MTAAIRTADERFALMMRLYIAATNTTMKQIAAEWGITESMVSFLIAGKRKPSNGLHAVISEWFVSRCAQ